MKWFPVLLLLLIIEDATASQRRRPGKQKYKINRNDQPQIYRRQPVKQHPLALQPMRSQPVPEIDMLQCPTGCVCQYAHFKDLSISRWINHMQQTTSQPADNVREQSAPISSNEVVYETNDDIFASDRFMKQATCILQAHIDPDKFINALPHDLQALILLYTDIGHNKTVNLSSLKPLNQLNTLEIRGGSGRSLRLIFDEPLTFLQHANFESVTLLGSDNFKGPDNPIHPSDSFDYKPRGELFGDPESNEDGKLAFAAEDSNEILPYHVYMEEVKRARMPSFYGWDHLEILRIYDCQLNELQWEMFDGLQALQHLSLERNAIAEIPAFSFYGAAHIRTLSLANNHIHDLHYRALAGLLELEVLNLRDNRLRKLSERSFPPFPKLRKADFRGNPITLILPASFWVMNTTEIMLFDSREYAMQLWGNQPFESLANLKELFIGNVSISDLENGIFKDLMALEKLTLKGTVQRLDFDAFAGLNELRRLDLSNCGIMEISMDAFMGCTNLQVLNLANNSISYLPPGLLDDQKRIEEIYLENNKLTTLPTTFFLQPKLRVARLSDNPWQCNCDMINWRPKITNQERGPRIQRCLTDFYTGKQISCRQVDNFIYNNRFAPRCSNYNGRSVFYVLRKQLQCAEGRIVHTKWRIPKTIDTNEQKSLLHKEKNHQAQTSNHGQKPTRAHFNIAHLNTLDYVLQQKPHQSGNNQQHAPQEDISNEI